MTVMRSPRRRLSAAVVATAAAVALGAGALPAVAADGPVGTIENAGAPGAIKNSYLITLDDDASSAEGRALAKKYGAKIKHTYKTAINGLAVELSEKQAKKLAAEKGVETVVQDQRVSIDATQTNPPSWGLDRIDQPSLPLDQKYTYPDHAGQGVTAYIIDTGIRHSHQDFGGRAKFGFDAFGGNGNDGNGHGTHVAGTVGGTAYGVAKKTNLVSVKVLSDSGSGTISGVVAGVDWVANNAQKPAVANMSLGGGANSTLDNAVRNAIAKGITFAVAAGNDNRDASGYSPARVGEALTVGSTTNTDARSSFSNYGSIVDIFAPGSSIASAWHTSDTAVNTISGTSMAAPHVAGAAALVLGGSPNATPAQVGAAIDSAAATGKVGNPGSGSPNKLLQVGGGGSDPGDPGEPGGRFENTTDYPIRDHSTVESPISVTGQSGNAPSALKVEVDIKHTWIGDLRVDLVAPNGTVHRLKDYGTGGSSRNINQTYTVNASSSPANGTWKLRVSDNATWDTGYIDKWALQF
ncbi:S8 family peptidase [Streptomyces durbertensis]|uniref:S8 family peptidase n=1 Tax=Streptomyces durbertensis TaxID=2448886 RepID=A0ABR6EBD5_9ACTN|nr:S8 family peptidase [Streptomyces durbertensis]MBB1242488.1 S8 family peptidase [Streptomyces durbertensis]